VPLLPQRLDRISASQEVLATLDPRTLSRLYDQREHTEMTCFVCHTTIMPEDDTDAQIVILASPGRDTLWIRISHPDCLPSCVIERTLPDLAREWATDWVAALRPHAISAVLVWEMCSPVFHGDAPDDMQDAFVERLRTTGFRGATDRLNDLIAPVPRSWRACLDGDAIVLRHASGDRHEFSDASDALPAGWLDAARSSRRILAVHGSGFGLDRFQIPRLDEALQAGVAVCALIPWAASPQLAGIGTKRGRRR
jgi:hypothetical protein